MRPTLARFYFLLFLTGFLGSHGLSWSQVIPSVEKGGILGIYADAEATSQCLQVPQGEFRDFPVIVTTGGNIFEGFTGAEFRIEVSNPEGYLFSFLSNAIISVGDPFDVDLFSGTDGSGLNVAFSTCQTLAENAGEKIEIGQVRILNLDGGPTSLTIKRHSTPSNPRYQTAVFTRCDPPRFTAVPMSSCKHDENGELIISETKLNDASCSPTDNDCPEPCGDDRPGVAVSTHVSPAAHCSGDPIDLTIRVENTSLVDETVDVLVNRNWVATEVLGSGSSTDISYREHFENCDAEPHTLVVAAIARGADCSSSTAVEEFVRKNCIDCPSEGGCVAVIPSRRDRAIVGEIFSVDVVVGSQRDPVIDLFGISGRLSFTNGHLIEAIGVDCIDENGRVMDLGSDVLCFGKPDNEAGYIDFAVTRKAGASGANGVLRVARCTFRMLAPTGSNCSVITLGNLEALDSRGASLCVEPGRQTFACSRPPCTVWPGDTNNDGIVNEDDVATLAFFWGQEGPPRSTSCSWQDLEAECFAKPEATLSDTYGDGRVGPEDLLCIGLHWGLYHDVQGASVGRPPDVSDQQLLITYQEMLGYLHHSSDLDPVRTRIEKTITGLISKLQTPRSHALGRSVPNPFNPSTTIHYSVASEALVKIAIYDVLGRSIRMLQNQTMPPGHHTIVWNGRNHSGQGVGSGIYYVKAEIGSSSFANKLVLVR